MGSAILPISEGYRFYWTFRITRLVRKSETDTLWSKSNPLRSNAAAQLYTQKLNSMCHRPYRNKTENR